MNKYHFLYHQTLRYLAELPPNIPIMKNELGMMVSLENLFGRSDDLQELL